MSADFAPHNAALIAKMLRNLHGPNARILTGHLGNTMPKGPCHFVISTGLFFVSQKMALQMMTLPPKPRVMRLLTNGTGVWGEAWHQTNPELGLLARLHSLYPLHTIPIFLRV